MNNSKRNLLATMYRLHVRRLCLAALLALLPLFAAKRAPAMPLEWSTASGGNGHYYQTILDPLTWPDAKLAAESMTFLGASGYLATITSAEENTFIEDNVYTGDNTWIGLTDSEAFGGFESFGQPDPLVDGWVWVTGEPVVFTDWNAAEPNNQGNEDFAHIALSPPIWNDNSGDQVLSAYVVEFVPEPSSLILGGLSLLGLLAFAWRQHRMRDK